MTPRFRADHVGSLLRPPRLRAAFRRHRDGSIDDAALDGERDHAIRAAVAMQEELGLLSITDGEFRRASYWAHFVDAVGELDVAPALFEFTDDSGERMAFSAPHVTGPIRRTKPICVDEFRFLHEATRETPKITMPSPSTMHFWRGPHAGLREAGYGGTAEFFADLVAVYVEEMAELARLGATYVQLDEVALAMLCDPDVRAAATVRGEDPDELVDSYVHAIRAVTDGRPPGMTVAMHMCRGNYGGRWMSAGGYEPIAEQVFGECGVDALFCEFDSLRAGDFRPLRYVPDGTGVVLGIVSTKTPELEPRDELLRRVDEASTYVPVDRLGLSPQCGFASTVAGNPVTEDDERRKLALVVETAREVWES